MTRTRVRLIKLYMALNKACKDAIFISLPKAPHGNWNGFLTSDALREGGDHALYSSRLLCCEPDAVYADMEDGDGLPGQIHEAVRRCPAFGARVRPISRAEPRISPTPAT
jgi:hypothetical protein